MLDHELTLSSLNTCINGTDLRAQHTSVCIKHPVCKEDAHACYFMMYECSRHPWNTPAAQASKLTKTPVFVWENSFQNKYRQAFVSVCVKIVFLTETMSLRKCTKRCTKRCNCVDVCQTAMLVKCTYPLSTLAVILLPSHSAFFAELGHVLPPSI